jgi:PAS domain S-box-containing protein
MNQLPVADSPTIVDQGVRVPDPLLLAVAGIKQVATNTYEVSLRLGRKRLTYLPGQYINLTIPQLPYPDPRGNRRDFSLISTPKSRSLAIAFRRSDSGFKRALLEEPGVRVEVSGPFGSFTLPESFSQPLVFIAGGIGITPFMSMLRFATDEQLPYDITLLYVVRTPGEAAYLEELRALDRKNSRFSLSMHVGHLTADIMQQRIPKRQESCCFIAGPSQMVLDTQRLLLELGVVPQNIKTEQFSGYAEEIAIEPNPAVASLATVLSHSDTQEVMPPPLDRGMKLGEGMEGELSERSLSDLEALLQALSNTALVSETNAAGLITFANDKFVEISKYSRDELIGQNHRILKSGLHTKEFYENMWATITRGRLWRGLLKNRAKDGAYYWVDTSIAPILGPDGRPAKYISVRFPITERQQAEEELQERAKQQSVLTILSQEALANPDLRSLFDTAAALLSQTLNVEYCAVLKLLPAGKEFQYEAGVGLKQAFKSKTKIPAGRTQSLAGFTLASGEAVTIEDLTNEARFAGTMLLHDHSVVSGAGVIIHGTDGPFGILEVLSTQKRMFSSEDIDFIQAVANLLANAARNQLDKRKDEFLGIASHELKTPLTSIKTYTQLLQAHAAKLQDQHAELLLAKVDGQINRLTELIDDLLDISRINAGKIEYKDEEFELSRVVEEVVEEQQLMCRKHRIDLHRHGYLPVFGDKYRIGQVITNLITNAAKYSPDSDKIIVTTEQQHGKAVVSVEDFGVGVPETEQNHIFERFYQGDGVKRNDFPGGLGLGLYISSDIIKRHHGHIWVESEEGKGARFAFSLPTQVQVAV